MVDKREDVRTVNVLIRKAREDMEMGWLDSADQKLAVALTMLEGVEGVGVGPVADPRDLPHDYLGEIREVARELIEADDQGEDARCYECGESIDRLVDTEDGDPRCPECGENPLPPVGDDRNPTWKP